MYEFLKCWVYHFNTEVYIIVTMLKKVDPDFHFYNTAFPNQWEKNNLWVKCVEQENKKIDMCAYTLILKANHGT